MGTRRTQKQVLQDRLDPLGYDLKTGDEYYHVAHRDNPNVEEVFEILADVRKFVEQLEAHPANDTMFQCVINEIQVRYEPKKLDLPNHSITGPDEMVDFLRKIFPKDTLELKEHFFVVVLNNAKKVVGYYHLSVGGMTSTIVDPAEIFRIALITNGNSIVLAHNHPSGTARASGADIKITKRCIEAGRLLSIDVADHIILTKDTYLSMRQEGLDGLF